MAKIKNIDAFCSYCGTERTLELVKDAFKEEGENKRWGKCKKCKQMIMIDLSSVKDKSVSLDDLETDDAIEYSPTKTFEVGNVIFHKGWEDFGKITNKEILSNGQKSITVDFQKSGTKKLIESILKQNQQSEVN